jgi:hypothetical protein
MRRTERKNPEPEYECPVCGGRVKYVDYSDSLTCSTGHRFPILAPEAA